MRLMRVLVAAVILAAVGMPTAQASASPAGRHCPKVGQVTTWHGKTYRCTKHGHTRVWKLVRTSFGPSTPASCVGRSSDNASVPGVSADPNRNILIAQDNLWFHGMQGNSAFVAYDGSGALTTPDEPWIGYYDESDRVVNERQIDLAADHGVDAFSQEWIAPRGEPGSLEADLDDAFLTARNLCRIRWSIFDDLNLRLSWKYPETYGSQPPNFDDPRVRDVFVTDMTHFAAKYFGTDQYLKIDGRPVVEIWATWNFRGSVDSIEAAVLQARQAVRSMGYDVYLVGDEEVSGPIDRRRVALWDATTSFIPMLMGGTPFAGQDNGRAGLGAATAFVDRANAAWVAGTAGVTVTGSGNPVSFQPGFAPQYDDTTFRRVNGIPGPTSLLAMSADEIRQLAQASLRYAQPVGQSGRNLIWVGTWNNYPESTQVEATRPGAGYPGGNTGTDILDVLSGVFGRQTFGSP